MRIKLSTFTSLNPFFAQRNRTGKFKIFFPHFGYMKGCRAKLLGFSIILKQFNFFFHSVFVAIIGYDYELYYNFNLVFLTLRDKLKLIDKLIYP